MSKNERWYESDDPRRLARGGTWLVVKWGAAMTLAVLLVSGLVWGFMVVTANIRGQGNAVQQKNEATNRIQAQAQFHQTFETIKSLDQRLTDAQAQLSAFKALPNGTPFDPSAEQRAELQRNVIGLQQQCRIAANDYNADTEKYTLQDFRDADLPFKIDATDPFFTAGRGRWTDYDCSVTTDEKGATP